MRKFKPLKVVSICDYLSFFLRGELKDEIFGETVPISLYLFIEAPSRHPVELGEVRIKHHLLTSDTQDSALNSLAWNQADHLIPTPFFKPANRLRVLNLALFHSGTSLALSVLPGVSCLVLP